MVGFAQSALSQCYKNSTSSFFSSSVLLTRIPHYPQPILHTVYTTMRMPSSSSVILATLASSASLSTMVSAAPTDPGDAGAVAPPPGNDASAAGAPDLSGILAGIRASCTFLRPLSFVDS